MEGPVRLTYEPAPGERIDIACRIACEKANKLIMMGFKEQVVVDFTFNGTKLTADGFTWPSMLQERYDFLRSK